MALPTLARIKSLFPTGWAAPDGRNPLFTAIIGGLSDALNWVQDRQAYTVMQTRIATATGFWLDLIAWDFFGPRFRRRSAELDAPFRKRVLAELFRPRVTRAAIALALTDLTGKAPRIVELWNTGDCGAYDTGTMAYAGETTGNGRLSGYDCALSAYDLGTGFFAYVTPQPTVPGSPGAGCWGSLDFPNQMLITAYRGTVDVVLAGCGGYDTGALSYGDGKGYLGVLGTGFYAPDAPTSAATDAEIYDTVARTVAGGNIGWVKIQN